MSALYWSIVNSIHKNQRFSTFEEFLELWRNIVEIFNLSYTTNSSRFIASDKKIKGPYNPKLKFSELHYKCKGKDVE